MKKDIAILAGDGIGPEVMDQALRVLSIVEARFNHQFTTKEALIGGAAFENLGSHFPNETKTLASECDAILFGSVGGPVDQVHEAKWKDCEKNALLGIRKAFSFNANYRPAKVYPALESRCPLKKEIIGDGVDVLIIRELLGDIYFGLHETVQEDGQRVARDVAEYTESQIEQIAVAGFKAAALRSSKLTSVDKANVLDTSRLWREVVTRVANDFPDVELQHILVDNCAMQIIQNPGQFDVILAPNMFGDILSDAAAVLPGSLGLTPSASLNSEGFGMYEPSGGSAQDIAGKGVANPIAQILSLAMMLQFSFGLSDESKAIEDAIEKALDDGARTGDIAVPGESQLDTRAFTDVVIANIESGS